MIYITGDKHGNYQSVFDFCKNNNTSKEDILIVLGDAGINYYLDGRDKYLKSDLNEYPITFFSIHGNHEERPENINSYQDKLFHNGKVFYEKEYPNLLFAKDGEIYNFNGYRVLVIGGAYSVDKYYRLRYGYNWYSSEQPDELTKKHVLEVLKNNKIDIILSHTCPYKYLPREMFLSGIDESMVDNSTEYFLDEIESNNDYLKWYCGHFHTDKEVDKMKFMFNDIEPFIKKKVKKL